MHQHAQFTADIGAGPEPFESLGAVQDAVWSRVSGIVSSRSWYARTRYKRGAKVRDAQGVVIAYVSYNARAWDVNGKEIV